MGDLPLAVVQLNEQNKAHATNIRFAWLTKGLSVGGLVAVLALEYSRYDDAPITRTYNTVVIYNANLVIMLANTIFTFFANIMMYVCGHPYLMVVPSVRYGTVDETLLRIILVLAYLCGGGWLFDWISDWVTSTRLYRSCDSACFDVYLRVRTMLM